MDSINISRLNELKETDAKVFIDNCLSLDEEKLQEFLKDDNNWIAAFGEKEVSLYENKVPMWKYEKMQLPCSIGMKEGNVKENLKTHFQKLLDNIK